MCRSRRDFRKLIDVGLAGGEERGDDPAALVGEQPAVRAADFFEQAVRAQQRQLARNPGRLLALFRRSAVGRIQQAPQIAVAQTGQCELPATHRRQERRIVPGPRVERAVTLAVPDRPSLHESSSIASRA